MQETQTGSLGGEDPWRRKWQPAPVFLPGKSHGQRSLAGYSPWGLKESDTTYWLNHHIFQYKMKIKEKRINCLDSSEPWFPYLHGRLYVGWQGFWEDCEITCVKVSAQSSNCKRCCWCSVAKLCLTLCSTMDCSTAGSSVLRYLPEFVQIYVHWVSDAI